MQKLALIPLLLLWYMAPLQGQPQPDHNLSAHHSKSLSLSLAYSAVDEILPEGYAYSPLAFMGQYRFAAFGAFNLYAETQFARAGTLDPTVENFGFGLNLGITYNLRLSPLVALFSSMGSGPYFITVETSRQAKGFIFSDNFELGLNYWFAETTTEIQIRARFRHISNAGLKSPNGGIDNLFVIASVNKLF